MTAATRYFRTFETATLELICKRHEETIARHRREIALLDDLVIENGRGVERLAAARRALEDALRRYDEVAAELAARGL